MLRVGILPALVAARAVQGSETPRTPVPADPPAEALFTGTVAGKPVVARLRVDARGVRAGVYYYRHRGKDIALLPVPAEGYLLECPGLDPDMAERPCDEPSGAWSVALAGGRLEGEWRASPAAKSSKPIGLVRDRALSAQAVPDRYESLRGESLSFIEISRHQRDGVVWRVVKEALSGVSGPLLVSGPRAEAVAKVNVELEKRLREDAAAALGPGEHEVTHTVEFANARLFSVGTSVGWYTPGAAHPSNGFSAVTWDLGSGEPVEWARLFRLVDPTAPRLELGRKDLLAAAAIRRMRAGPDGDGKGGCLDVALARYGCTDSSCEPSELYPGAPPGIDTWVLFPTEEGLAVVPSVYSEAERGCRGTRVALPWAEARSALLVDRPLP